MTPPTDSGPVGPREHEQLQIADGRSAWPALSRREFLLASAGAGVAAVALSLGWRDGYAFGAGTSSSGTSSLGTGTTPEQIHLTWGSDPSSDINVSWASPSPQSSPQVSVSLGNPPVGSPSVVTAVEKTYTDGLSGETVYTYHAMLSGLTPGATYTYVVADPTDNTVTFTSSFTMAGTGRFPFAFTSFGDLGTPGSGATYQLADGTTVPSNSYSESQWNAYTAVTEVELMASSPVLAGLADSGLTAAALPPLFHLLNGDLCYGDKATVTPKPKSPATTPVAGGTTTAAGAQPAPEVWRDYGLNVQRSAANRPWMPCVGNHEVELDNADNGLASYLTRFMLPSNASSQFPGSYYSFQVGSVLFISLDANDVCYQGAGAYNVGGVQTKDGGGGPNGSGTVIYPTAYQYNQYYTGTFTTNADGTLSPGGATPNAQTLWLEAQLDAARASTDIDWIVVQMHQCTCSSTTDNGSDAGIRQTWVPLFDKYEVDLVLNGHDHDYERSWPVRGFTPNLGTSLWTTTASVVQQSGFVNMASPPMVSVPAVTAPAPNVNTFTPTVVTTDQSSPFDTTKGTVYLTLGGGGTDKNDNIYNPENMATESAFVTTFTQVRTGAKPTADSWEPAAWSAITDPQVSTSNLGYPYGVAYFSVDPGEQGSNTTISVTYVHAMPQVSSTSDEPGPSYTQFDQFQLTRPRSDAPPIATPEFPSPVLAVGAVALVAGAAAVGHQRHVTNESQRLAAAQLSQSPSN